MTSTAMATVSDLAGCSAAFAVELNKKQAVQCSLNVTSWKTNTSYCLLCKRLPSFRPSSVRQRGVKGLHAAERRSAVHASDSGAENLSASEEWTEPWLQHLPPETSPLYTHSLMCIEGWLRSLDFVQSVEDPALWTIKREDWHAELRLDVVDLLIRYLKSGPGTSKDIERKFSYGVSRKDLEAAIMSGP